MHICPDIAAVGTFISLWRVKQIIISNIKEIQFLFLLKCFSFFVKLIMTEIRFRALMHPDLLLSENYQKEVH